MMLVCNIEVCDWYSSWSWNWLFNSFVVLSKLNMGFSKTLLIQFQQAMPVSVMPLTTSSIKASLQLDHFFTWCTIVKISKDRENKADREVDRCRSAKCQTMAFRSSPASEKIWVSRHTDQVNLHPGHQPGVGVGVVVFL